LPTPNGGKIAHKNIGKESVYARSRERWGEKRIDLPGQILINIKKNADELTLRGKKTRSPRGDEFCVSKRSISPRRERKRTSA